MRISPIPTAQPPRFGSVFHLPTGVAGSSRETRTKLAQAILKQLNNELKPTQETPERVFGEVVPHGAGLAFVCYDKDDQVASDIAFQGIQMAAITAAFSTGNMVIANVNMSSATNMPITTAEEFAKAKAFIQQRNQELLQNPPDSVITQLADDVKHGPNAPLRGWRKLINRLSLGMLFSPKKPGPKA